jgi:hypothetical protein
MRKRRGSRSASTDAEMLRELAQLAAEAIAYDGLDEIQGLGSALAEAPGTALVLLDQMVAEARKKRPDDQLIEGFEFLLGEALAALRRGVETGHPQAVAEVAAVQERVAVLIAPDALDNETAMLILSQFTEARLDPGSAIRNAVAERHEREVAASPEDGPDINDLMAEIAEQLGDNIFALQAQIVEQASLFPEAGRGALAGALLGLDNPALRDAALGWLLDTDETTRRETAGLLQQAAETGRLGGVSLRRLIALRNWLPEAERPALDGIIRTLRRKGVEPAPLATADIRHILVTAVDGAGSRSLYLFAKDGRKLSVLIKLGGGLADAWTQSGLSRAEAADTQQELMLEAGCFENDLAFVRTSLAHALAEGLAAGRLPSFWLVDVIERAGVTGLNPERLGPEELVARLLADIPAARLDAPSLDAALAAGATWQDELPWAESWLEESPAVSALLDRKRLSAKQRVALVLEEYLPGRRRYWAETLAWTAFAAQRDEMGAELWEHFALVARELLGDRPLSQIPVMSVIARQTVESWRERRKRGGFSARE